MNSVPKKFERYMAKVNQTVLQFELLIFEQTVTSELLETVSI
jgi:hypothetical protein